MIRGQGTGVGGPPPAVLAARARGELVVSAEEVTAAVDRLSVRLSVDLFDADPLVLTVMHGAMSFAGALLPRLGFPLQVGYLHVGRYRDQTHGGRLVWHAEPAYEVRGRTVLIVDDVLDRGDTLAELVRWGRDAGAARVLTAVLADKQIDAPRPVRADYAAAALPRPISVRLRHGLPRLLAEPAGDLRAAARSGDRLMEWAVIGGSGVLDAGPRLRARCHPAFPLRGGLGHGPAGPHRRP